MIGCKRFLFWLARKLAFYSGHYLVPISKPLEWGREANEFEKVSLESESEGLDYGAGYWTGRGVELVRLGGQIISYNASPDRTSDKASSVQGIVDKPFSLRPDAPITKYIRDFKAEGVQESTRNFYTEYRVNKKITEQESRQ